MAKTEAPLTLLPEALRSGELDAVALWEPQVQRAKLALGRDAIEFRDPAVYTEKFNLCTTQANLEDPCDAAADRRFRAGADRSGAAAEARTRSRLAARRAGRGAGYRNRRSAWPYLNYPGTLAPDLLDVFERQDAWIAKVQGRAPRTAIALATLIDGAWTRSVYRDASMASLHLDIQRADQLAPALHLGFDHASEFFRRAERDVHAHAAHRVDRARLAHRSCASRR